MTTDTSNKLIYPMSRRGWKRRPEPIESYVHEWSWERIMARIAFIVVCILLLGIWVHPYMSGAFERRHDTGEIAPAVVTALPDGLDNAQVDKSPIAVYHGTAGFWRLGRAQDGAWWFISPENKREFMNTVTTVQPFQQGRDADGVHFVSRDWDGSVGQYDGDLKAWGEKTLARVKDAGFKGLGAWSHPIFHELDIPMTRDLNIWAHYQPGNYRLYSADWESYGDKLIEGLVSKFRDNRNLVGYYLDNELDWSDASVGPSVYFNDLPATDPNRQQVIKTIKGLWPTVAEFNKAWKLDLPDYTQLETLPKLSREPADAYSKLFSVWLEKLATDYFRVTTTLVRKYDPNHLVLGVRFAGWAPPEVCRASRNYTDAQSINYYVPDGMLDPDMFAKMNAESGQPIIITEYSFHALDGRSGNRNTFGFQAQVLDQRARAEGYALFTSRMARVPYLIGADWFQWSDEPASGRSADGEDVNFGVVDVDDRPYEKLVDAIRATTPKLNALHAGSPTDDEHKVWRDSFADRPVAQVLKLQKPINVNGNLSEWSESNKLPGIRVTQAIGADRITQPVPNVYLGWREEGLYLAFEVFDTNIESIPASGRWWTRDNLEFWINTRAVPSDLQVYDAFSHQFFFIPNEMPIDGSLGLVGQWHRPGDSIPGNLIPHPGIVHQSRVLPDRYVVEMFIPGSALHGWDPINHPEIAFNVHVRNFHEALDYFWSAPKESLTQLRPNTWGRLMLSSQQYAMNESPRRAAK